MPLNQIATVFQAAMDHVRDNDFKSATTEFDTVLSLDPAHFAARLFQANPFLNLGAASGSPRCVKTPA